MMGLLSFRFVMNTLNIIEILLLVRCILAFCKTLKDKYLVMPLKLFRDSI